MKKRKWSIEMWDSDNIKDKRLLTGMNLEEARSYISKFLEDAVWDNYKITYTKEQQDETAK